MYEFDQHDLERGETQHEENALNNGLYEASADGVANGCSHVCLSVWSMLPGTWKLQREISGQGKVSGEARFTPQGPDALHYEENGKLYMDDGRTFNVSRQYIYRLEDGASSSVDSVSDDGNNKRICVYFVGGVSDGKLYHEIEVEGLVGTDAVVRGRGKHLCVQDWYATTYEFGRSEFKTVCGVTGPEKDYVITSHYAKLTEVS